MTGLGAIAATGHDVATLWDAARQGQTGIGPITAVAPDRLIVRTAAEVRGFDPAAHFDAKHRAMLDRTAQFALVAAREAVRDAGLHLEQPRRGGVIVGASIGHETFDAAYLSVYGQGAARVHPLTVPRIMPSGPASLISMECGLRGPSYATASACASAGHAIGQAFHAVRCGMLDAAVTGGSDAAIVFGVLKGWEALRVLSPDTCRPFSRDRAGIVLGEGAGMLVLEDRDRARARGARIHAEIMGFGMSADAAELTAPDMAGAAWAMRAALADGDIAPEAVGYINAHGTGTRLNDRTETAAVREVFGRQADRLAMSSSKSMLGHTLCAGGGLELVLTILALRDKILPPTIGYREADPECDIDCVPNEARAADVEVALSNSFAFGGLNAVLAVRCAA